MRRGCRETWQLPAAVRSFPLPWRALQARYVSDAHLRRCATWQRAAPARAQRVRCACHPLLERVLRRQTAPSTVRLALSISIFTLSTNSCRVTLRAFTHIPHPAHRRHNPHPPPNPPQPSTSPTSLPLPLPLPLPQICRVVALVVAATGHFVW